MEIPVEKNKEYIVDIIDNGFEGEGIAKIDGYTIFINNAIKGEKCKILIVKVTKSHAYGKLIEIIEKAKSRMEADCTTYKRCGGCNLRHIKYEKTLEMKKEVVQNLVNKTLENKILVNKTIGMENPYYYRNKAQYPFGINKNGEKVFGIYAKRTHEIIEIEDCKIQNPISTKIAKEVINFVRKHNISVYNEETKKGLFRHLIVKVGIKTNEVMCVIVLNGEKFEKEEEFVNYLLEKFSNDKFKIKTIVKNINTKNTNVILGNKNITLYGDGYINDKLGNYTFKISPMSFYQTNPVQTEVLYGKAIEAAELKKSDVVLDLYCGIGTIGIYASSYVDKVYGIEIVEQAIEDAKENARINKVENIKFRCGAVEDVLEDLLKEENIVPNIVFVDPPRRGLDKNTIDNILKLKPEKVIYISCNPATMVRDINMMEADYKVKEVQPVDMFPFTRTRGVRSSARVKEHEKINAKEYGMKIELVDIDNALRYYQINDINYKNKCYKCIEDINTIQDFNIKVKEIYNILYSDKIYTLWERKNMKELFGENYNSFITNVLVLLGYKLHERNMENKNYNIAEKTLYKKRVTEALTSDIYIRKLKSIRISQMIWAGYFINTKLIEVGRLQYEKDENHIKIHIPSGEKLEIEKVLKSIKKSKEDIKKYFNLKNLEYFCDSWLLSNQINAIIDPNSNIGKFYNLFEVQDGTDAREDILNFVFNMQECDNYNNLSEGTSLQKLLKKQLIENKSIKIGCGKLKKEIL